MTINAGDLRHEIRVENYTTVVDSSGSVTETWATFATVRAAIEPLSGREYFEAAATQSEDSVRFRMHYLAGVDTKMRLLDLGASPALVYNIQSAINVEGMGRELEILATITNDET